TTEITTTPEPGTPDPYPASPQNLGSSG
uniref:Aspartate transcarbamoylase n=1 Tax=Cricetidae sp. TaxID=36483 RepID=Q7M065_CRISP